MHFFDVLSFGLSVLGIHSFLHYLRFLLPRNIIPLVSLRFDEAEALLNSAEAAGAIRNSSESRMTFEMCEKAVRSDSWSTSHLLAQTPQSILTQAHD